MTLNMETLEEEPELVEPPTAGQVRRECLRAGAGRALEELRFLLPPREGDPPALAKAVLLLLELAHLAAGPP